MTITAASLQQYRNNLKDWKFGKEAACILEAGARDIVREQGSTKPTSPKADSSSCFDISPWAELPLEILDPILIKSGAHLSLRQVSTSWKNAYDYSTLKTLWQTLKKSQENQSTDLLSYMITIETTQTQKSRTGTFWQLCKRKWIALFSSHEQTASSSQTEAADQTNYLELFQQLYRCYGIAPKEGTLATSQAQLTARDRSLIILWPHIERSLLDIKLTLQTTIKIRDFLNSKPSLLQQVKILDLSHLNLIVLPPEISQLSKLAIFNCKGNMLTTLPNLDKWASLTTLICSHNALTILSLNNLPLLQTLDCSHNAITILRLSNLPLLSTLNCSTNALSTLPVLKQFSDLFSLNYSGNNLTLPPDLSEVPLLLFHNGLPYRRTTHSTLENRHARKSGDRSAKGEHPMGKWGWNFQARSTDFEFDTK